MLLFISAILSSNIIRLVFVNTFAFGSDLCRLDRRGNFRPENFNDAAKVFFDSVNCTLCEVSEYKRAREEMKELYNVKSNVEHLLNISEPDNEREQEKTRR